MNRSTIIKIIIGTVAFLAAVCLLLGGIPGQSMFSLKQREAQDPAVPFPETVPTEPPQETTVATEPPSFQMPEITWKKFPTNHAVSAARAFVYDCQTGEYLYTKGSITDSLCIASITKLFSLYVASQYLQAEEEIVVESGPLGKVSVNSSTAGLAVGDVMTVSQLYTGALMASGNDAAYVIATAAGRKIAGNPELPVNDAVTLFVEEMNKQATTLGMTGSYFTNPDGYHDGLHYTCPKDLVTIAQLSLESETIMASTKLSKTTVTPVTGQKKAWQNTNSLVNPDSEFYCPYAVGLKTGYTSAADYCLLSAFEIEGHRYIVGAFGCPGYNGRYNDALYLFNTYVIAQ